MKISKILSSILHPIFMPLIVICISLNYVEYFQLVFSNYTKPLYIIIAVFTLILPLISSVLFVIFKKVESLEMRTKEERNGPIFVSIMIMIIGYPFFKSISQLSPYLTSVYLSSVFILIIAFLITKRWKISLHMLGIGGATGSFIALNYIFGGMFFWVILFLFLSGLLVFARLNLKAHNRSQVYVGFLLGCIFQTCFIVYFNSIISTISIFLSSMASLL